MRPDEPVVVHSRASRTRPAQDAARAGPGVGAGTHRGRMTTTLSARGPEDLLAAVPGVLGFRPERSLVMLTFEAGRSFHARVDLPPAAEVSTAVPELAEALLEPCHTHAVGRVALVVYCDDPAVAAALAQGLTPAFEAGGVGVLTVLRAHRGRWWWVPPRPGAGEEGPWPYDDEAHPFTAQAVFEGRVTHPSREALRATVAPDAVAVQTVAGLVRHLPPPGPAEARRVVDEVARWVADSVEPDAAAAARVLAAVTRADVRDAMLYAVTRATSADHLRVWTSLLRRAPDPQVPDTAAVTAFCAWQTGDGALAWCALDRCFAVEPGHRLGTCLAECLTRAVPPSSWEEVVDQGQTDPGPEPASA